MAMNKKQVNYQEQLYCLIVSQLLNDGYISVAESLLKASRLHRYGNILPSNELFNIVFAEECEPEAYIEQEIVPQEADGDIKRDVILRELRNSGGIKTVEVVENHPSVERTSNSLKKIVQKKTKFNYEGDSVVSVSHVKLDDEMFLINDAGTQSNDNSILQSEQVATDTESKAVISPTIRVTCDGNISCYEEVKLGDELMATLDRNQKTLKSRKFKVCYHCNTHQSNLGKHILEHHATRIGKGLKCKYCGRIIQKKLYNFNEHLKTHNDAMHFLCADCGIGFKRAAAYRKHLESVHSNCDFACNICGKTFKCSTSIRAHKYTHTKEYNLPCNTCGKRFRYTRDLLNHELIHTDAKPQKCSICEKAFRTQSQVLRHVKQQHGTNITYYCGLCSYSVIQKCNLKIHMKRHTGVKYGDIFVCSSCLSGFPSSKLLNEHKIRGCKKTA